MRSIFSKTLFSTIVFATLTACSSGGGSNDDNAYAPTTSRPTSEAGTGNSSNTSGAYVPPASRDPREAGRMYIISADSQGLLQVTVKTLYSKELERIGLDSVALQKAKELNEKINQRIKLDGIDSINNIASVGMVSGQNKAYVLYTGSPTENMPASGTIHYSGHSVVMDVFTEYDNSDILGFDGIAEFTADLGSKKLTGTLTQSNFPHVVNISADITGNSFTGHAKSDEYTKAIVEGKFYGNDAIGLAGILKTDTNILRDENSEQNGIIGGFYGFDKRKIISSDCISPGNCYTYGR